MNVSCTSHNIWIWFAVWYRHTNKLMICQTIKREKYVDLELSTNVTLLPSATDKGRIFKVAELFMSSGEKWARCGFMGCCWLGCVCESMKERQTDRERNGKQKERVWGREGAMSCSPNYSARLWFIWQLLDGGLSTRGHLHQCLTSDLLQLLKWTQLSLLNLHPDRRNELLLGRIYTAKHTHKHTKMHMLAFRATANTCTCNMVFVR